MRREDLKTTAVSTLTSGSQFITGILQLVNEWKSIITKDIAKASQ